MRRHAWLPQECPSKDEGGPKQELQEMHCCCCNHSCSCGHGGGHIVAAAVAIAGAAIKGKEIKGGELLL